MSLPSLILVFVPCCIASFNSSKVLTIVHSGSAALAVIGVIVSITMSISRILMARFRMFVFVIVFSPFLHIMKSFVRFPISVIVMRAQKGASRPKNLRSDRACKSTMVIGAAQKSRLRNSPSLSVCLSVCLLRLCYPIRQMSTTDLGKIRIAFCVILFRQVVLYLNPNK